MSIKLLLEPKNSFWWSQMPTTGPYLKSVATSPLSHAPLLEVAKLHPRMLKSLKSYFPFRCIIYL